MTRPNSIRSRIAFVAYAAAAALWVLTAAEPRESPRLIVTPVRSALDVPLHIRVMDVAPGSTVVLRALVRQNGREIWASDARFRADRNGVVDASRQAPIAGSYSGVHPMGLVWSMHQMTKAYPGLGSAFPAALRYVITATSADGSPQTQVVQRLRIAAGVTCQNVDAPRVVAYECHPKDGRAHPGIIVLGGSEGGEQRGIAALFAEHGYAAMALAYFGTASLPVLLREIPVETVGRGLHWFAAQPFVERDHIGVWGGSKGGELALLSAAIYPQIHAVVSQYGSPIVWYGWRGYPPHLQPPTSSWSYKGRPLPYVPYSAKVMHLVGINAPQFIDVEKTHGPILFIAGDDDKEWPSLRMAELAMQRLRLKRHHYPDDLLAYHDAGHGFSAPYYPAELVLPLGGTRSGDAAASRKSWRAILTFFERNL